MVAHPEGADDHKRCRVDHDLRQRFPQEAAHLLCGEVRGHIDGQDEQRYGDSEDTVRESDDPVVEAPLNLARAAGGAWGMVIVHRTKYSASLRLGMLVQGPLGDNEPTAACNDVDPCGLAL